PHTQLAQNIICAYLTGARFFELKTVQILDSLEFEKPCIDAEDEGYNTEWSTELSIIQAYQEYVKSWFLLHILKKYLNLSPAAEPGFIFNMSVGYDLKGISSPLVDNFIESLKNALGNDFFNDCKDILRQKLPVLLPGIDLDFIEEISPRISSSITLSTMHGCPPGEQQSICSYLMKKKGLHTFVKLNPTLLGHEDVIALFHTLGFHEIKLNPESFIKDIQYPEAIRMISNLQKTAAECDLVFGVKLSNTLAVENNRSVLPGQEMYMSGRALYPLTISLAARLAGEFAGNLKISYAGGINAVNVADVLSTGIKPVTVATDLLKPGGYYRLRQMAESVAGEDFSSDQDILNVELLHDLADKVKHDEFYSKDYRQTESMQIERTLPLTNCYIAPCQEICPIHQDVPEYIHLIQEKRYREALWVIYAKNPLPFITGYVCDHQCMFKCVRNDYEQPLPIRDLKRIAAELGFQQFLQEIAVPAKTALKAAIIGAGPCGLATASYLSWAGIDVTLFDLHDSAGGMVKHTLPPFRLPDAATLHDLELLQKLGISCVFNCDPHITPEKLHKEGFKYVIIAIGAWQEKELPLAADPEKVLNTISFLNQFKKSPANIKLGRNVAVIGGGNSAMDGARAAKRVGGVKSVFIIYRRTIKEMPADREEFANALQDGVVFKELLQPVTLDKGELKCQVMQLGVPDESGRKRPLPVEGKFVNIPTDTVIIAIGEEADPSFLRRWQLPLDHQYRPITDENLQTGRENIFIGGDARTGPATVVEAIRDARKISDYIIKKENLSLPEFFSYTPGNNRIRIENSLEKKGNMIFPMQPYDKKYSPEIEASRCLDCALLCNKCVEVCPNRANIAIAVPGLRDACQIIHLDSLCNECGNCQTFCPYEGAPYRDKLTLYEDLTSFAESSGTGFVYLDENHLKIRYKGIIDEIRITADKFYSPLLNPSLEPELQNIFDIISTISSKYSYLIPLYARGGAEIE
ncbi:MAG: putative selenate reductase subunit YgfK, partial [Candidatus Cloacimonetes bacterium]|nr:putative selenate reductase subunit YgfK [Candidatus Cloacimonadota bacterium]